MKRLLRKLENSIRLQIITFTVLMIPLIIGYFAVKVQINKRYIAIEEDFSWVYQVDKIDVTDEKMIMSGWAFYLNQDAKEGSYDLILRDIESEEAYFPKMKYVQREDVNNYFLCEYDYKNSGFIASIATQKLDLENSIYEVYLRPEGIRKSYKTGIYIAKGQLMFTNPKDFAPLETAGTDLEKVVSDGVLRVYRPDYGMYVYQYEGDMYWIAEPDYGFVDNDTYVQFQMFTTQVDKLPEDRLANNWLWSNIGFMFQSNELSNWNTGKYRVTKCALPTEYSITEIWTGNYIGDWIWLNHFRPWYEFD